MNQQVNLTEVSNRKGAEYWRFVDGLRAIAVLSVVLYHAGVPWLTGGYVGVDIFFVISGYLIINQIVSGLRRGNFSFSEFWSRRALRILPPYMLVIVTCGLIAPFVLVMPSELQDFANEVAYSALMVVNHLFLSQQGYFDQASDTKVLLHLWSLAVEEQFYIVIPIALVAIWRFRIALAPVALAAFIVSLVACVYWTGLQGDKNYSFFVMPLRAWEFIAGGAIGAAVPFASRMPRVALEVLAVAGLAAIGYAVFVYNHATPFPSYYAIVPVFGACAVILAGLSRPTFVTRALSVKPMIAVGLISYSWYLWHWPLLAFARIYSFGDHVPMLDAAMVVLSFLLSVATYFVIERPIKRWREVRNAPLHWKPTFSGIAVCALVCVGGYLIFSGRSNSVSQALAGTMLPDSPGSAGVCDLRPNRPLDKCAAKHPDGSMGVLIGDSQAAAATRALVAVADEKGSSLMAVASGGCISLMTATMRIPDSARAENCRTYRENSRRLLATIKPEFAILYSYWNLYAEEKGAYYFVDSAGQKEADQKGVFLREFNDTVSYLKSTGISRILVIGPTPTFPRKAPECAVRSDHYGMNRDEKCSQPRADEEKRRAVAISWLAEAISADSAVQMIDPFNTFCGSDYCRPFQDQFVLFNDTNHISDAGVRSIERNFKPTFDWLFGMKS